MLIHVLIHVLFGQRKETYPGEHAPEALEVMSEFDYADNGVWLHDHYDKQVATKNWESLKIVAVQVDGKALMQILRPTPAPLVGEIQASLP